MRGRGILFCLLVGGAVLACGEKTNGASSDGGTGDGAVAGRSGEGGVVASGDAGAPIIDDVVMPQASAEELAARMRHLLEAIAQNNPDLATDVLFPRDAYVASKDATDPQKSWEKRLSGGFRRAVERTHKKNKGIEQAKFVSFELGHSVGQISPKKKDFKKPLWRVKHSRLTYSLDGKTRHIDIAEMTAWRGNWYVTRLR